MIVDVHGHVTHPKLFERFPMPPALLDIEGMLERKGALGIELTIVGSPVGYGTMTPVPGFDAFEQPLDQLKAFHEWLADTVRKHAPRLAAYAFTNPFGGDELLAQTAETLKDDAFVGVLVNTSVRGEYLDSERADDFFALVAELRVPVFLHPPAEPVGSASFRDFRLVEQVGRFLDVTAGLAALVFGGRLERDPDLEVVAATAGGAIGLLAARLDQAYQPRHWGGKPGDGGGPAAGGRGGMPRFENRITEPPSAYLRRVYVDTANASVPNHLANLEVVGAERVLFGTDSPPLATPLEDAIALVDALPVAEAEREQILRGNAERLFRLAGRPATASDA
ncbi:MAG: amidohydrolase [Thermoleophilia bacterium]|nr:amidohydrolase [Thermoleophilia bacterium]